tara:strand:- start:191 stop:442 length:252 start_codon:yes stop_codon:yes gene_type:complete
MHLIFRANSPVAKLSTANSPHYQRHHPEQILLYQLVDKYYPESLQHGSAEGHGLPDYVHLCLYFLYTHRADPTCHLSGEAALD